GMGRGSSNGIYDSVRDMIQKWPASKARRALLLVSSGIDLTDGVMDTEPGQNTVLQRAIDAAERSGTQVYTIYASGTGRLEHNLYLVTNGQGCLGRIAGETGGDSYFSGFQTPVNFQPFLDSISRLLGQQYRLTFLAAPGAKAGFTRVRVSTELSGVEILAQDHVYVPAGQ
ncbi:MAG: hypothetical protein ACRD5L_02840, partial [Bryobacteraceae bacterium]